MIKTNRLYLSPPHMSEEGYELKFVNDAFDSNWIAPLGPHVDGFEKEFAAYHGIPYAAALSSGTSALHLALITLGVSKGDEVLCSTFTFSATANAIIYVGAYPVFIDSNENTWNMDPNLLLEELERRSRINKLPKAVLVVDILGQSADWEPILVACRQFNIPIIEDAAEALGATYHGLKTGTFGDVAIFSFNGNKIITTSGGGMLVSRDKEIVDTSRFLATQARDSAPHYEHSQIGYNYRMSNVLAAIGRGQLKILDRRVEKKRWIFEYYRSALSGLPGVKFMPEPDNFRSTRWLTCILVDSTKFGATRDDIRLALETENIESRPLWKPMHLQPVFKGCLAIDGSLSVKLFENGLCLPSGTALTCEHLSSICSIILSTHRN